MKQLRLIGSFVVVLAIGAALFFKGGLPSSTSSPHSASTPAAASGGINLSQ